MLFVPYCHHKRQTQWNCNLVGLFPWAIYIVQDPNSNQSGNNVWHAEALKVTSLSLATGYGYIASEANTQNTLHC